MAFSVAAGVGIISQMLGAILGYILYVTVWNVAISGVLYSAVTAVLLHAVLNGMIPMAHLYDPNDIYTTKCTFIGLIFFSFAYSILNIL